MTAIVIDGKARAAALRLDVARRVERFKAAAGRVPGLTVILVGDDPASEVYVRNKGKQTREAGMMSEEIKLPATTTEAELLAVIARLNADPGVDGILLQLPLPKHLDANTAISSIDPDKDVDGLHPVNAGRLALGLPALVPCTPAGCLVLLKESVGALAGLDAVVIGRSALVGKPIAQLLLAENATVTVAHSRTRDLAGIVRRADIVVAAVGRAEMVRGDWIKPGATVIDVGINRIGLPDGKTRLIGDVAYGEAAQVARAITPVPGGVGPMTIACLLDNTLIAAGRRAGVSID